MEGVTMRKYLAFFILLLVTAAAIAVPLAPIASGSKTMSCTSASSRTTIPSTVTVGTTQQLELQNAGSAVIFVEVGDSSVAAVVATSYPILVGQAKVISVNGSVTNIACIVSAGTHTLYVTQGAGE
jgi:hypothetical protein